MATWLMMRRLEVCVRIFGDTSTLKTRPLATHPIIPIRITKLKKISMTSLATSISGFESVTFEKFLAHSVDSLESATDERFSACMVHVKIKSVLEATRAQFCIVLYCIQVFI